jgi:hypothetical protein
MRHSLLTVLVMLCAIARAQVSVTGRVVDAKNREPLAFVPVTIAGTQQGVVSDIDGRFQLNVPALPVTLRTSYVGYAAKEIIIERSGDLLVELQQTSAELTEVVVDGSINPAHRIIQQVHANRRESDSKRYHAYRYTSYSKTVFTGALDSALLQDPSKRATLDTSDQELVDLLDRQHILLMEGATKRAFIPPSSSKEEVIAMRMSGLKDPSLLALSAQTETFSIYDPLISISGKSYLGPIGQGSWNKYRFVLEDTLWQGADTVFVISYRPRRGKNFDALKGTLYINTNGYAVQNVIAEPAERDGMSVKFQQLHQRVRTSSGAEKWFPVQLNTSIYMDNVMVDGVGIVGIGRTYLRDIELDADVQRKEVRGPEIQADRLETRRDEAFWNNLRKEPLDGKDLRTYAFMDSLGEAEHLDRRLKGLTSLLTGKIRLGYVDLLLGHVLRYNGYEGFRLGAGLATNERISRVFTVSGYFGHGFADQHWKYGGDLTVKPIPSRALRLKASYENDVAETGGVAFLGTRNDFLGQERVRLLYMDRMDRIERYAFSVGTRLGGSLMGWFGTERALRVNDIGYRYAEPVSEGVTLFRNHFITGAFTVDLRWAYQEKWARLPDGEYPLGTKYPVVHVQVMQAINGLYDGELDTWRVNAMVNKTFRIKLLGRLSLRVLGGMADPKAPMPFLYNLRGMNGEGLLAAGENAFETMVPNEFLADRYLTFHLRHSFGNLLMKTKRFRPEPSLVYNAAIGELSEPALHRGLSFREPSAGFHEAGLRIDKIYSTLGLGVYYRFGPLAFAEPSKNVVAKLCLALGF